MIQKTITKKEMIELFNNSKKYLEKTPYDENFLSNACAQFIENEENLEKSKKHDDAINKIVKENDRACRNKTILFAMQGEDKSLLKDSNGKLKFTAEKQILLNDEIDSLNDILEQKINLYMDEKVEVWLPVVKKLDLPTRLLNQDRVSLDLLIEK